jgi:hypothetical protein
MATTPTTAERLAAYLAAEQAVLTAQFTRVDLDGTGPQEGRGAELPEIRKGIAALRTQLAQELSKASGVPTVGGLTFARARLDGQ